MIKLKGKTYRNTQEQVCENANDIAEIKEELENLGPTEQEIIDLKRRVTNLETRVEAIEEYLDNLTISSGMIQEGAITSSKIANNAITNTKLADNSVTETKVNNGAISTNKLSDQAVTTAKISSEAITTSKIADESITPNKIQQHIYEHNITIGTAPIGTIENSTEFLKFKIYNARSTEYESENEIREWLYDNGYSSIETGLPATGRISVDNFEFHNETSSENDYFESIVVGVRATNEDDDNVMAIYVSMTESGTTKINEQTFYFVTVEDSIRRLI